MKQIIIIVLLSFISNPVFSSGNNHVNSSDKEIILETKTGKSKGSMTSAEQCLVKGLVCLIVSAPDKIAKDLSVAGIPSIGISPGDSEAVVRAWIEHLSKDYDQIVVIGHHEGALPGLLASMDNPKVSFLMLVEKPKEQSSNQSYVIYPSFSMIPSKKETTGGEIELLYDWFRKSVQPNLTSEGETAPTVGIEKIDAPILIAQCIQLPTQGKPEPGADRLLSDGIIHFLKMRNNMDPGK